MNIPFVWRCALVWWSFCARAAPAWRITTTCTGRICLSIPRRLSSAKGKRWGCASSCAGWGDPGPGGGTGSAGGAASGNLRRLYGGCRTAGQPLSRPPARVSAPGGDGAHYRPALRAGRPAAGDGEAGPPAGDPVAQPFIGNRRLSRRRAAEIRHDAGAVLRGTRLAGK